MNSFGIIIAGFCLIVVFLAAVFYVLTTFLRKQIRQEVKESQDQFLQLARQQFETDQLKVTTELETRKQAVESSVSGLKDQLDQYQKLLRDLERDRAQKYGSLESELKNASMSTAKLQETTNNLNNILGNNQKRGQWGERMAEDIIRYAGLVEGVPKGAAPRYDASPHSCHLLGKKDNTWVFFGGKHKGETLHSVVTSDRGYIDWMLAEVGNLSEEQREALQTAEERRRGGPPGPNPRT